MSGSVEVGVADVQASLSHAPRRESGYYWWIEEYPSTGYNPSTAVAGGHAKGGGAISAVAANGSPLFLGSGERFEDFDPFNAKSLKAKLIQPFHIFHFL